MSSKKRVVILGSTGSIGESTLRVIAAHRDQLELVGIAARTHHAHLARIARKLGTGDRAEMVALAMRAGVIR